MEFMSVYLDYKVKNEKYLLFGKNRYGFLINNIYKSGIWLF